MQKYKKLISTICFVVFLISALSTSAIFPSIVNAGTISLGTENTIMGVDKIYTQDDNGNSGYMNAYQYKLGKDATLQSLSVYVKTAAGKARMAVYSDVSGRPGTKLAETAEFTPVVNWNSVNVTTPIKLIAGNYWISIQLSDDLFTSRSEWTGGKSYSFNPHTYGTYENTYPTTGRDSFMLTSIYATLTTEIIPNDPMKMGVDTIYKQADNGNSGYMNCLLYTSPSPRDRTRSRMPSSA